MIIESENLQSVCVVTINGKMDVHSTPVFLEFVDKLTNNKQYKIIVDMGKVDFISSYGLGALANLLRNSQGNGGNVALVALNPDVTTSFEVTGLLSKFLVFKTKDEALKSFT